MTPRGPGVVRSDSARERVETADRGFKLGIVADAEHDGSGLWFGFASFKPGTEAVSWDADARTYEGYHVTTGTLTIAWSGPDNGEEAVGPGDSFYFAPGRRYTIDNRGYDEVRFVWAVTPAPDAPAA